jgi:osmotically inducible protein OsmC
MATTETGKTISRRRARSVWTGDVQEGSAQVAFQTSGAIPEQRVSLAGRTSESGDKQTDPEELLAASHAACYSMALSAALTQAGTPPEQLTVQAVVELNQAGEGFAVGSSKLKVTGRVPGLDQAGFEQMAKQADEGCPISNVIRGSADVEVEATLES